ncbi:hexulose-6-phosphate isomerase [Desulfosarcina ovata subsp. sediminis]|uniref:Hexulose-6-phosphate isomerase n=1 Tax=Desulfosarcina ovata subsp. sediminis TaxID=885957 RepID=A0A5K7ZNK6_9BACT|nr:type II toxin-antitoxin system HicA family toxin [Desulfosarcina ovata]BBO82135.1 hexulose-6-phosphate isomerase [Desulfosarcina ovata subsp. sediminis]
MYERHLFLETVLIYGTISTVKRKHQKTLDAIFIRPVGGNIKWRDIEALFVELGAELSEREGSRIGVRLFGERRVFHRPHPSPNTDKGAVASIRKWLADNGVTP